MESLALRLIRWQEMWERAAIGFSLEEVRVEDGEGGGRACEREEKEHYWLLFDVLFLYHHV